MSIFNSFRIPKFHLGDPLSLRLVIPTVLIFTITLLKAYLHSYAQTTIPCFAYSWLPFYHTLLFGSSHKKFLTLGFRHHGSIFQFYLALNKFYATNDINLIAKISQDNNSFSSEVVVNPLFHNVFRPTNVINYSDFNMNINFHKTFVKFLGHKFLPKLNYYFVHFFKRFVLENISLSWKVINVNEWSGQIAHSVGLRTLLGDYDDRLELLHTKSKYFLDTIDILAALNPPDIFVSKARKYQQEIANYLSSSIPKSKQSELAIELSKEEHVDSKCGMMVTLFSSYVNFSSAMFWILYFLLRDQKAMKEIQDEVYQVLLQEENWDVTTEKTSPKLCYSTLEKLVKLKSYAKDVIRINSSALLLRQAIKDTTITLSDGRSFEIKKGDNILGAHVHHDEDFFPDPYTPKVDRLIKNAVFYDKNHKEIKPPISSFGRGKYQCPGQNFAYTEISIVVAWIFAVCDIELLYPDAPMLPSYYKPHLGCVPLDPRFIRDERLNARIRIRSQFAEMIVV